jgi:hypothetical protein
MLASVPSAVGGEHIMVDVMLDAISIERIGNTRERARQSARASDMPVIRYFESVERKQGGNGTRACRRKSAPLIIERIAMKS